MPNILRKVKSMPFLLKRKKTEKHLEAFLLRYEPPSFENDFDLDYFKRLRLAERLVENMLLLHEQHDRPRQNGEIWYWGNDINREFPMTH